MIIQVENALGDEDCRRLITIYDRHVPLAKVRDYTGHPVVYWDQLRNDPEAAEIVPRLVAECLSHLADSGKSPAPASLAQLVAPPSRENAIYRVRLRHGADFFRSLLSARLELATPLYPETVILAAIGTGGHHSRHADNCRQDEQGEWVANHTPQRAVSAIYYLNDGFDGGEIFFEQTQLTVKPRRGLLLAFPSDADHVHEVLPVRCGVRYTMPIWFTEQQGCALSMAGLGLVR